MQGLWSSVLRGPNPGFLNYQAEQLHNYTHFYCNLWSLEYTYGTHPKLSAVKTKRTQCINRRCQKSCKGLKMGGPYFCVNDEYQSHLQRQKTPNKSHQLSCQSGNTRMGEMSPSHRWKYGVELRDMRGRSRSSKGLCACRGRCDGSWRLLHWCAGERSPASCRYTGVSLPRFPVWPERSQNMAKKRAERREADGMSTSEDEIKANARNSQALKGGLWLWWLNSTVYSILTKQHHEQTWTKHNETVFLILLRIHWMTEQ